MGFRKMLEEDPASLVAPALRAGRDFRLVQLGWASFGRASNYTQQQGQPVWSDDCPVESPVDLSQLGWSSTGSVPGQTAACAAYVLGARKSISVRIGLSWNSQSDTERVIHLRARSLNSGGGGGGIRVGETKLVLNDSGAGEVELTVESLPGWRVGTVEENWIWECRGGDQGTWQSLQTIRVRLYFTADVPRNSAPRQSFYHIACAAAGATTRREAEENAWRHFTSIHTGGRVCNAQGQELNFWRDVRPMDEDFNYVTRNAQSLALQGDSSCMGWGDLLKEAFAIHGIPSRVRVVVPSIDPACGLRVPSFTLPDGNGGQTTVSSACMLVRSYRWAEREGIENNRGPHPDDVLDTGGFNWRCNIPVDSRFIVWDQVDVEELGRAAQSQAGQLLVGTGFLNHAVVRVDEDDETNSGVATRYYDPSFAIGPCSSLGEYEDRLLGRGSQTPGGFQVLVGYRPVYRLSEDGSRRMIGVSGGFAAAAPAPPGHHLREVDPLVK